MKKTLVIYAIGMLAFCSCKKDDAPGYDSNKKAALTVEFDNIAGSSDLALHTGTYTNQAGEAFTVTKLMYYVSNFRLTRIDGTTYIVPQDSCYFLIDESNEETHEPLLNVPEGEYRSISFVLGVDSARSVMDAGMRTGVLDITGDAAGMYWDQQSGYIFFNMEGTSPAATSGSGNYVYHIGGYGGNVSNPINNLKTITLDLTQRGTPKVKSGKETNIHLMVDVLKLFSGNTNISIEAHPSVQFDPFSTVLADNYAGMIRHDHTEN